MDRRKLFYAKSGVRRDADGRRIPMPAAEREIGEGKKQIETQTVKNVDASRRFFPARKSCHSMHQDLSILLNWLHGSIDCYQCLRIMPFKCYPPS